MADSMQQKEVSKQTGKRAEEFYVSAEDFEIGSWFEFNQKGGEKVYGRLSWKSKVTGKLVFINRQDIKVRSLTASQLISELRDGQARQIVDDSSVDRTITSLKNSWKQSFRLSGQKSFRLEN